MRQISGLTEIIDAYDGLVVDLWGVMHNGKALFPQAVAALTTAKAAGKSVTLLSNAPRRRTAALAALEALGLPSHLFDDLVTSGQVAWQALSDGYADPWGPTCYFLGAEKDMGIQQGLDHLAFMSDETAIDQADWILNVGPETGQTDTGPFAPLLHQAQQRALPMICANPDLIVQRGTSMEICAGSIAKAYAELGGDVVWFGKPHRAVYDAVYQASGATAQRLLAVGDSFKTDVRGANAQGMDVLYVNTGIHGADIGRPLSMDRIAQLSEENQAVPTYVAEAFK